MKKNGVLIGLIVALLVNSGIAIMFGARLSAIVFGFVIGTAVATLIEHAWRTGEIHTMQDGRIEYAHSRAKFIRVFVLMCAGYLFTLAVPWLTREP